MGKISIYQVFTRLFGNKNANVVFNGWLHENGSGKFSDFDNIALKAIKDFGTTHIWFTGVIQHASCESYNEYGIEAQHPSIVKGKAGSPYAITDYYDVNPYLADDIDKRMEEFEALIERTHAAGLKAIIDFVPNHVARQYKSDIKPELDFGKNDDKTKSFIPTNNFYYIPNEPLHLPQGIGTDVGSEAIIEYDEFPAKATGNDQFHSYPSINDWYETVKLNYGVDYNGGGVKKNDFVPPIWDQMYAILDFWCSKQVDGIRCDMAEMVPVEFWEYLIHKIKLKYPTITFIAEVYNPAQYHHYIFKGGFDYLYDKVGLYDCLRSIISHNAPASQITQCWQNLGGIDEYMLRFLENHDEHRIAAPQFAGNSFYALPAMLVSATINTGPVMTYFGQEVGEPAEGAPGYSGDDGKTTIFDFYNVPEHQKWMNNGKFDGALLSDEQKQLRRAYEQLLNFSIKSEAISEGAFYDLMWFNQFEGGADTRYIYAYLRYTKGEKLLVVVNFHKFERQEFNLRIPRDAIELMGMRLDQLIGFNDNFSVNSIDNLKGIEIENQGIKLCMEPLQGSIYSIVM